MSLGFLLLHAKIRIEGDVHRCFPVDVLMDLGLGLIMRTLYHDVLISNRPECSLRLCNIWSLELVSSP